MTQYIRVRFAPKDGDTLRVYRNEGDPVAVGDQVEVMADNDRLKIVTVADINISKPENDMVRAIRRKIGSAETEGLPLGEPEPAPPPAGHNRPPPYDADAIARFEARVRQQADAAGQWVEKGAIDSEERAESLNDFFASLRKLGAEIETKRKADKEPHLGAGRAVDAAYATLQSALEIALGKVNPLLTAWAQKKRAAQEAAKRAAEAAARKAAEEAKAAAEAAQRRNDAMGEAEAEARAKAAEKAAREAASIRTTGAVHSASGGGRTAALRTFWRATITNRRRAFMALEEEFGGEIDELLATLAERRRRAAKGEIIINGVEFRAEQKVA